MKEVKKQSPGGLNAEIQSRIGHQLRAMYDDVVRQGVPDRFAELIRKLDGPEQPATQAGGDRQKRREELMPLTDSLRDDILASVPSLRAFAISLSGNGDRADDLVQETLLRALANIDSFQPGSNCRHGCSRSCATCSAPTIASGGARSRMPRAIMPKP